MHETVNTTSQVVETSTSDYKPQILHTDDTSVHAKIQPPTTLIAKNLKTNLPRLQALELLETSEILKLMKTFSTTIGSHY